MMVQEERVLELRILEAMADLHLELEPIRIHGRRGDPERGLRGAADHKVERDRPPDHRIASAMPWAPRRLRRQLRRRGRRLKERRHRLLVFHLVPQRRRQETARRCGVPEHARPAEPRSRVGPHCRLDGFRPPPERLGRQLISRGRLRVRMGRPRRACRRPERSRPPRSRGLR